MPDWLHALIIYILVAVLAGGIAYLGNRLGRKIGRKKMSVLGMRPRHTSNFITALTGILIAWTTMSMAATVSPAMWAVIVGIDYLHQEEARLSAKIAELNKELREGQIVWRVGEPILMGTLNPSLGEGGLREQVNAALVAANYESLNRNNEIARQSAGQPIPSDKQLLEHPTNAIPDLLRRLSNETEVTGLKVVAAQNCYYQGPVPVRLELMPVKRVFYEGEVITQRAVQPGDPHFLLLWYDFLEALKNDARTKGMIEINNSLGGGMTAQDLGRVSDQLSKLHAPGTLVAVARRDLYQTSPLDVKIEVRGSGRPLGASAP